MGIATDNAGYGKSSHVINVLDKIIFKFGLQVFQGRTVIRLNENAYMQVLRFVIYFSSWAISLNQNQDV